MGTPIQFINISNVAGDREDSTSLVLIDAFSSGGSRNVYLDQLGAASAVWGYVRRNTPFNASTDGNALMVLALAHYGQMNADGTPVRTILGVFQTAAGVTELWASSDTAVTFPFFISTLALPAEGTPDFAQLGTELVITLGNGSVKRYVSGILSDASYTQLAAPITAATTAIGLLDGAYMWKVVPISADGLRHAASKASVPLAVNKKQATVTWTIDPAAVSYEIYRTTGTGAVYFYETSVPAGGATSITSNVADLQLIAGRALQEYGDPPLLDTHFCEAHNQRIWYARTKSHPRRLWPSDPGLPYSLSVDGVFFDLTDGETFSDVITGISGNFKGMLVCWLERSVWTISGKGRYSGVILDYERRRTDAQTGTVSHHTVARVPAGSHYINANGTVAQTGEVLLAYLTPLFDIRLFDGENDVIISWPKVETLKRMTYAARQKAFVLNDSEHGEITWVIPVDGSLQPNYAISWNLRTGQMVERDWSVFSCGLGTDDTTDSVVVIAGNNSVNPTGTVYTLWDAGMTAAGSPITRAVTTKPLYGHNRYGVDLAEIDKRFRYVEFIFRNLPVGISFLAEWWASEAPLSDPPFHSHSFNTGTLGATSRVYIKKRNTPTTDIGHYLHSRGVRLRLSSVASVQWHLIGMRIAYQVYDSAKQPYRR